MIKTTGALLDPAWRWTRSKAYYDMSTPPSRNEDILVRRSFRYLSRLNRDDSVASQFALENDYPDIHWALKIFELDSGPRWYIEALVVAGEPTEKIADYLGQDVEIVKTYEALFFDVRSKLAHRGYILSQVMAQAYERGMYDREYDFFWKLLGLILGPAGLKNFWDSGKLEDDVTSELQGMLRAKILKDAVAASHVRKITQYNANEVIAQYMEMAANESETSADQKRNAVVSGLQSLLGSVKFGVMPVNAESDGAEEPRFDKFLENGGEK